MTNFTGHASDLRPLRIFCGLAGLSGILGAAAMLVLALGAGSGVLAGGSHLRLGLALAMGGISLVMIGLFFLFRRNSQAANKTAAFIHKTCANPILYTAAFILDLVVFIAGMQFILFCLAIGDPAARPLLLRYIPFVGWLTFLACEGIVFLPIFRFGVYKKPTDFQAILIPGMISLGIALCIWAGMSLSGLGLHPDVIGWHDPGAPILPLWVTMAWVAGVLCAGLGLAVNRKTWLYDALVVILLWLGAVFLWQAQPVKPNYFLLRPGQPNYEYYPYSDAAALDVAAQRILIGEGYGSGALKPLYTTFLAGLHALAGQRYVDVANVQVIFLAIFPALLYLLGMLLHHRLGGVIAAVLIILREAGAIALSGQIQVAHAKLLLSDLPTALGLAAFTLLVTCWLAKRPASRAMPILAGGMLGFFILLRPQMMALIPLVFLFIAIFFIRKPRLLLVTCLWMILGLAVSLCGWLGRTWVKTGSLMVNDTWQTAYLSGIYTLNPNTEDVFNSAIQPKPGESSQDFNRRIQAAVLDFIRAHPDLAARFVAGHFLHNQAGALLSLPASFSSVYAPDSAADWMLGSHRKAERVWEDCCSASAYVESLPFWKTWDGALPPGTILPILLGLFFLSLGIGATWRKLGWAGLFPLWIEVIYALSSAIGRQSGWRFILPVDWVVVLYFAVGLGQATQWAGQAIFRPRPVERVQPAWDLPAWRYGWAAALVLLIGLGATFPLVEAFTKPHFSADYTQSGLGNLADAQPKLKQALGLDVVDEQSITIAGLQVVSGRALYPRFYRGGQGEMLTGAPAYFPRSQSRMAFLIMNGYVIQTNLPVEDAPAAFPNAADVLAVGCWRADIFEARAVILPGSSPLVLTRSPVDPLPCTSTP